VNWILAAALIAVAWTLQVDAVRRPRLTLIVVAELVAQMVIIWLVRPPLPQLIVLWVAATAAGIIVARREQVVSA
jgi:hypothetical protein